MIQPCRIAIVGSPFCPIAELGERLATYHNLDFITLETLEEENSDYFADKIKSMYLDTGDLMSGSASQHFTRDPSDWAKMREMSEIYVNAPPALLSDDEKFILQGENFCVVSSEIPDPFLQKWSDVIVLLTTSEAHAVEWINKRRVCGCCGAVYHLEERPTQRKGYCDRCGSHVFQAERDLPQNVRAQYRLWGKDLWQIETAMKDQGNYIKINVDKFEKVEDIVPEVDRALRKILNKSNSVDWNYSFS